MPRTKDDKLTDKQRRFCEEYMVDLNATQAAIRAGYSENTANEQGSQNLAKLSIQEYIAKLRQPIAEKLKITREGVIKDIITIKERCMAEEPVMIYDPTEKGMVESGEYRFDSNGALKASDMLAKHIGFYEKDNAQSKTEITITDRKERIKKLKEKLK